MPMLSGLTQSSRGALTEDSLSRKSVALMLLNVSWLALPLPAKGTFYKNPREEDSG